MSSPLQSAALVAFIATRDQNSAIAFYQGVLGFPLLSQDGFAAVFDCHGTTLRVTNVHEVSVAPYTVLGWHVPDIAGAAKKLAQAGVKFERYKGLEQDELGVWTAPGGTKVMWFKDPDGHTLSLSQ